MRNSVGMLVTHRRSHRTLTGVPVNERKAVLADEGIRWYELNQAEKQRTFIRRELTERPVTSYLHKKRQVLKTLDVTGRECTAVAAPNFDTEESLD
jgi:hypothetical protein